MRIQILLISLLALSTFIARTECQTFNDTTVFITQESDPLNYFNFVVGAETMSILYNTHDALRQYLFPDSSGKLISADDPSGIPWIKSGGNKACGTAILGSDGTVTVPHSLIQENTRITLTFQEDGTEPVGTPYVKSKTEATSFTIGCTAKCQCAGASVFWMLVQPEFR